MFSTLYHAACRGLIHDSYSQRTRDLVAQCIRHYRRVGDDAMVAHCRHHFDFVGWPIKLRPNGRYT